MKKFFAACTVVAALAIFAGSAQANHGYYGGFNQGFIQPYTTSGYGFIQPQPHAHWHNTSHWDYHPTQVVPHGNHFHVQPGHYDFHQTGHYDLHW